MVKHCVAGSAGRVVLLVVLHLRVLVPEAELNTSRFGTYGRHHSSHRPSNGQSFPDLPPSWPFGTSMPAGFSKCLLMLCQYCTRNPIFNKADLDTRNILMAYQISCYLHVGIGNTQAAQMTAKTTTR